MSYYIETKGLDGFEELLRSLGEQVEPSASSALNDTAVFARKLGSQEIRRRINFKANYLDGGRLAITQRAYPKRLEAIITGRDRPTSLARFRQGAPRFGQQRIPPRVRVSASGGSAQIRKGFYMRLRRGNSIISSENANIGIAIRLAEGERIKNKNQMVPMGGNLYLLYGPSVGQVYRTVSEETSERVSIHLASRFAHYLGRNIRG
jgi:hypothetical protein